MSTSRPQSTISYNTEEFLIGTLNDLVKDYVISSWFFIKHDAEEDEKKDHYHVWIEPNGCINPMRVAERFIEPDPEGNELPLGVLPFHYSDPNNAIPYFEHNIFYLSMVKHEEREFIYEKKDFKCSNDLYFDRLYRHAFKASDWAKDQQLLKILRDGTMTGSELIEKGYVPYTSACHLQAYFNMRSGDGRVNRNGRKGHDPNEIYSEKQD